MLASRVRGRHQISPAFEVLAESSFGFFVFLEVVFFGFSFFVAVLDFFLEFLAESNEGGVRFCAFLEGSGNGIGSGALADAKAAETPRSLALRRSVVEAAVLIADTVGIMGRSNNIDLWLVVSRKLPQVDASVANLQLCKQAVDPVTKLVADPLMFEE